MVKAGFECVQMPPPNAPVALGCSKEGLENEVGRLNAENELLKKRLYDSQDEVNRLKGMIENQDKKSSKSDSDSHSAKKSQSRYWTEIEHTRFLDALQAVGPKDVKAIAQIVGTRNATQARTHAQKYFLKLARMKKCAEEALLVNGVPGSIQESWLQHVSLAFAKCADTQCKGSKSSDMSTAYQSSSSSVDYASSDRSAKKHNHKREGGVAASSGSGGNMSSSSSESSGGGGQTTASRAPEKSVENQKSHPHMGDAASSRSPSHQEWHTWPRKNGMKGLSASSNEESGATDSSSTHGNGTSHGSYPGSNQSYSNSLNSANNSDGANNSGNDNDSGSLKENDSASNDGSNSNDDSQTPEDQASEKGEASKDRMSD